MADGKGQGRGVSILDGNTKATVAEIGLTSKQIHEARAVRDAEEADPGIVRRTLDDAFAKGEEPTRAKVKRAVRAKSKSKTTTGAKSKRKRKRKAHSGSRAAAPVENKHDSDVGMLSVAWEMACDSARIEFFKEVLTQAGPLRDKLRDELRGLFAEGNA